MKRSNISLTIYNILCINIQMEIYKYTKVGGVT